MGHVRIRLREMETLGNSTGMWTDEEIDERECCANCGEPLPGDTDVVVDGRRWCSDCGYKVGVTGDDEATIAVPYESMDELVFGGGA